METIYVKLKSELTQQLDAATAKGLKTYRTRAICHCRYPSNRRNAVICLNGITMVSMAIKCRQCASRKEAV